MIRTIAAAALRDMLTDGGELALLDLREELTFSESHLLHARSLPLSRLELRAAALVPRRGTRVVLCDAGDGLAERGAKRLESFGYRDVAALAGGVAAWQAAGYELFSGVNVPSKAFGEFVEHASGTPNIAAEELEALLRAKGDLVVLDSRPFDEYSRISIPTGIDVPGAELVLRARAAAPDPKTLVVVNCAGRTRSIIGAQSLIDAGLPNPVRALRNGTMGWTLAGFTPDHGQARRAPFPSGGTLDWAQGAAWAWARRCGVERIDGATLARWRGESQRTTYLFDVRDPAEYEAGHLPGALSAPGGQLVQATDQYAGALGARIVCVDPAEVRAAMTAAWLRQMGWDAYVLAESGNETGPARPRILGDTDRPAERIDPDGLAGLIERGAARVIDLSLGRAFLAAHIPGAWYASRARLAEALQRVPRHDTLVLTSEDGALAALALDEAKAAWPGPVRWLGGGNAAWRAAGRDFAAGEENMAHAALDQWLKPYERGRDVAAAMRDYLAWEIDLLPRIARDGTCRFRRPPR